ncbi:Alpha/Beta hydrolase protein [Scleroderma yunnanense]
MVYEYIKQPWKTLYLTYQVPATLCVLLPVWVVTYALPALRPRPAWSWGHAITVSLCRHMNLIACTVGSIPPLPDHHAIVPSKEAQGVWIDGTPQLITADLKLWTTLSKVEPTRIPGYWYGKKGIVPEPKAPVQPGDKVFLFFHGGGYIVLSAHPKSLTSSIPRVLVELNDSVPRALAVEYRLSSIHPLPDRHPFPTALLDALAGYNYLVNVIGYNPSNVIMVGDSAGGNLALALVRYLVENKDTTNVSLPSPPGGLLLLSPWADMGDSHDVPGSSAFTNKGDIVEDMTKEHSFPSYAKRAYLGPYGMGMAAFNRYISPASLNPQVNVRFTGFPRTFIKAGGAERFLDQIRTLRNKMVADIGKDMVTYYEAPDAVHDYLVFPWHPACPSTLKAIQHWLA